MCVCVCLCVCTCVQHIQNEDSTQIDRCMAPLCNDRQSDAKLTLNTRVMIINGTQTNQKSQGCVDGWEDWSAGRLGWCGSVQLEVEGQVSGGSSLVG